MRPRSVLICHHDAPLHYEGVARWLASFTELAGIVMLTEPPSARWRRVKREYHRSGAVGLADVAAMRLYYRSRLASRDDRWIEERLERLRRQYPAVPERTEVLVTSHANGKETEEFIRGLAPDLGIALCKVILNKRIFSIPRRGTFVLHPGICPEYRNAHGCFWALSRRDHERVGLTLLRIDDGVDTGPIFGYFSCHYDERVESHIVIQHRALLDNLPLIQPKLLAAVDGTLTPLEVGTNRASAVWGQPRLSTYFGWKLHAWREYRECRRAAVS